MSAMATGRVNTTWKYGTGSRSASRAASQSFAAAPWHFGQCRLRQELYEIWPAERRRAAALDRRHHLELAEADMAGIGPTPCRAVAAEDVRDLQRWTRHDALQAGGSAPSLSLAVMRSNGLTISRMVLVATRV